MGSRGRALVRVREGDCTVEAARAGTDRKKAQTDYSISLKSNNLESPRKMYYLIRVPEKVFIAFILFHFVLLCTSLFYVIFWFSKAEKTGVLS